jgi:ubiquinone/menaquinone biosynthesis C-methylase UbiE
LERAVNAEKVPDLDKALAHYALIARRYDHETRKIQDVRRAAIHALNLQAGQTVIDAGCGTGACLPELAKRVGSLGTVIGVEPSAELILQARQRATSTPNVRLIHSAAETADLQPLLAGKRADAVLFCYTHDLMQSQLALEAVFSACGPGARVVAVGTQLLPWWLWPVRRLQRFTHRHYITARDSMNLPYATLSNYLDDFAARRIFPWHSYLATGTLKSHDTGL